MNETWRISTDTERDDAIPYFCWDTPVTNAQVRRVLREGTEEAKLAWVARIMTEARYDDVWKYISLRDDIIPRWDRLSRRLGRRRTFWEFLLSVWTRDGLIQAL